MKKFKHMGFIKFALVLSLLIHLEAMYKSRPAYIESRKEKIISNPLYHADLDKILFNNPNLTSEEVEIKREILLSEGKEAGGFLSKQRISRGEIIQKMINEQIRMRIEYEVLTSKEVSLIIKGYFNTTFYKALGVDLRLFKEEKNE